MANLNKVMLIGRLTRDPETRTIASGSKVANFGFAVNNRRKNASTGQWDEEPVFIEVAIWNRGEMGRKADLAEQYLRKGHQVYIEGHLKFDQWTTQDGQKRSKLSVVADDFQFLEPRGEGGRGPAPAPRRTGGQPTGFDEPPADLDMPRGGEDDVPF
jgi:single-strand DNA-binding protein